MRRFLLPATSFLLVCSVARAQQPSLPGAPQPGQSPVPAQPALPPAPQPAPAAPAVMYRLGETYQLQLRDGTTFVGKLDGSGLAGMEFMRADGQRFIVAPADIVSIRVPERPNNTKPGLQHGYYDIGNGSRYFFGPSGRNLRAGEGVVQDIDVYLLGVNYGITDHFSIGGYTSIVPGVSPGDQVLLFTPKVGFNAGRGWTVGGGVLYMRIPTDTDKSFNAGLLYGVASYGGFDNNFSVGLGYGFADGSIGNTPTIYLAGQRRVSRRISVLTENYFVAAHSPLCFGLYGMKISWPRLSLGLGAAYAGYLDNRNQSTYGGSSDDSFFQTTYIIPIYVDLSFRFGKPYQHRQP